MDEKEMSRRVAMVKEGVENLLECDGRAVLWLAAELLHNISPSCAGKPLAEMCATCRTTHAVLQVVLGSVGFDRLEVVGTSTNAN